MPLQGTKKARRAGLIRNPSHDVRQGHAGRAQPLTRPCARPRASLSTRQSVRLCAVQDMLREVYHLPRSRVYIPALYGLIHQYITTIIPIFTPVFTIDTSAFLCHFSPLFSPVPKTYNVQKRLFLTSQLAPNQAHY